MKKRVAVSGLIVCALFAAIGYGQSAGNAASPGAPAAPMPSQIKGLKDAFAGKFLIGTAADPGGYSDADLANLKANYNVMTPENCMKPQPIHPSEDTYNWTQADTLVKWCTDNNIKVWGHNLCWHSQTANWFFTDAKDPSQWATRDTIIKRFQDHIKTVVGRYKGKLMGWDVVNEAINDNGEGTATNPENLRNDSWYQGVGPEYLTIAFKAAHDADPKAELNYNDYNIEQGAVTETGKHARSMLLLKRLIADGAPITGVGIQGHWHLDTNLAEVEKAIEDYASIGLKVSISELDVTATGTNSGALGGGGRGGPVTDEDFKKQAVMYAKLFDIFNRHAASIERVTLWGTSDRRSWRSGQYPLVFDAQLQPKPAYQAIIDVAEGKGIPPLK